jgi:hypothetical protein
MASAEVIMPTMGGLVALYGGPPLLVTLICARRALKLRSFGLNAMPYYLGTAAGLAALIFNIAVVMPTLKGLPGGDLRLTGLSIAGLVISWLCFWAWVAIGTVLKPRRRVTA